MADKTLEPKKAAMIVRLHAAGHSATELAAAAAYSRASVYRHVALLKAAKVGPGKGRRKIMSETQRTEH